jgi:hypothetical protein
LPDARWDVAAIVPETLKNVLINLQRKVISRSFVITGNKNLPVPSFELLERARVRVSTE